MLEFLSHRTHAGEVYVTILAVWLEGNALAW